MLSTQLGTLENKYCYPVLKRRSQSSVTCGDQLCLSIQLTMAACTLALRRDNSRAAGNCKTARTACGLFLHRCTRGVDKYFDYTQNWLVVSQIRCELEPNIRKNLLPIYQLSNRLKLNVSKLSSENFQNQNPSKILTMKQ